MKSQDLQRVIEASRLKHAAKVEVKAELATGSVMTNHVDERAVAHGPTNRVGTNDHEAESEFRFEGNKTQYKINCSVIGHMDRALASNNRNVLQREINEGKKALVQRNKHILLAEKYGWDTVKCYTAEPLASNSEDEQKIKRAIKESKALRNEKKASSSCPRVWKPVPSQRQGPSWTNSNPRQVELYNSATKAADLTQCFCCRKRGHIARECRSANARYVIAGAASTSQPLPQS